MRTYDSFKEVRKDLKRFNLERQIAREEAKLIKAELQESLQPYQWIQTATKVAGKYGIFLLFKRLFK